MAYFIKKNCPYCAEEGNLFVWRCADGKTLALSCDECSALWPEFKKIEIGCELSDIDLINNLLPGHGVAIYGGAAGWAVMSDMAEHGLSDQVAGEGDWVEIKNNVN